MTAVRIGVVGGGSMGYNHCRVLSELPEAEFAGVADPSNEARERIHSEFGGATFASVEDLMATDLQALVVAVPTRLHSRIAELAIEGGLSVLVEKPLAQTSSDAERLTCLAAEKGVALMVGHIERFNPVIEAMRQALGDEQPISIDITRVGPLPPRINDVGVIIDLGVHDIDLIRFLTGSEFARIACFSSRTHALHEDAANLCFEMENGTVAHVTTNWITPFKVRKLDIATPTRFIEGDLLTFQAKEYKGFAVTDVEYSVKGLRMRRSEPLKGELSAFLRCVVTGDPPPVTGRDGVETLKVLERCLDASNAWQ